MINFIIARITPEFILNVSLAALVSAVIAFIIVLYVIPPPPLQSLGVYESPQRIINIDEDTTTPLITISSTNNITVYGKRCINRKVVQVINHQTFTKINPQTLEDERILSGSTRVREVRKREDDCEATERIVLMPNNIEPGIWRIDSIDISTEDGTVKLWATDNFEVR